MQSDILDDAVALVEDAENRDPLRHRSYAALAVGGRGHLLRRGQRCVLLLRSLPARREGKRGKQWSGGLVHVYSGIHGS
jgi:hypothetical protein